MEIGLQLFSIRDVVANNMEDALRKTAEIGYEGVEFAGYGGYSPEKLTALLDSLHLKAAGTHVSFYDLMQDPDGHFAFARDLGLHHFTISVLDEAGLKNKDFMKKGNEFCEKAAKYGLTLSYHNHRAEFNMENGRYLYDNWMEAIPAMRSELDVCWVKRSGLDPVETMHKWEKRLPLVHLKEVAREGGKNPAIGDGIVDFPGVLRAAKEIGCEWAFVEIDEPEGDPVLCAAKSRGYIKGLGY